MSLVRLNDVTVRFDNTQILREAFFRLENKDRVGLIGRNGSGKTTLLKLVLDQVQADEGTVTIEDGLKIGYFSQFSELDGQATITEILDGLFDAVHAVERELAEIDAAIAADPSGGAALNTLIERQSELFGTMDHLDGWDYPRKIDRALTVLGFTEAHRTCAIDELSGGWRNRAALAKIILEEPDILLLDEPTNFLDVQGVEWLETWFRDFRGAAIIVSHDRTFLDAVATRIVEVENYHLHEYPGNFAEYIVQKQFKLKNLEQQFVHESELLAFEAEGIADRREAAKAAKGNGKDLGKKLAGIKKSRAPRPVDEIITEIYGGLHVKDVLCRVGGLEKSYGEKTLFTGLEFEIRRGNRIVVLGTNGSGKSTLLRVLDGEEKADAGTVAWAAGAKVVSYNRVLDELDPDDTVSHSVNAMPDSLALRATRKSVARFLSMFQFSEADKKKRIRELSGGQKARVAMAQCLLSGASVLLLDEPTNHLDLASTQVMERALVHFPGAVVVVSHDRFFTDKIANRMLVFGAEGAEPGEIDVRVA